MSKEHLAYRGVFLGSPALAERLRSALEDGVDPEPGTSGSVALEEAVAALAARQKAPSSMSLLNDRVANALLELFAYRDAVG